MAITIRSDIDVVEDDDRDYGKIVGRNRVKAKVNYNKRTQVFDATHDGAGNRLPYMYRSFISFTYGGRYIEDFGLIAITENNSLNRNLSANFEDIVTSPAVSDGQFYWGTHYQNNQLSLTLFTDYISQKDLDDFKSWFRPGVERELILAENPFRGIMARVGTVSTMEMLPDEEKVEFMVAGNAHRTSITSYKGSIHITFTMDDPFWYSLANVLDYQQNGNTGANVWKSANGDNETILYNSMDKYSSDSFDALKVIYEDRIPILAMFDHADTDSNVSRGDGNIKADTTAENPLAQVGGENQTAEYNAQRAHIAGYTNGQNWYGYVGLYFNTNAHGFPRIQSGISNRRYLYYAGTAPCYPTIEFTIQGTTFSGLSGYISCIGNEYSSPSQPYSEIIIEGEEKHILKLTTPSIWTGYNQAYYILSRGLSGVELDEALRDGVHHKIARDIAFRNKSAGSFSSAFGSWASATSWEITINCKTGTTKLKYCDTRSGSVWIEENAGDMIRSNYLKITERNIFTDEGWIGYWDTNKKYSQIVYHTLNVPIDNVRLEYRYMYL